MIFFKSLHLYILYFLGIIFINIKNDNAIKFLKTNYNTKFTQNFINKYKNSSPKKTKNKTKNVLPIYLAKLLQFRC